jgi:hypothetical protein
MSQAFFSPLLLIGSLLCQAADKQKKKRKIPHHGL